MIERIRVSVSYIHSKPRVFCAARERGNSDENACFQMKFQHIPMHSVFIIDDHPSLVEGLEGLLGSRPRLQIVGTAHGYKDALFKVRLTRPEVVILDVHMPEIDGYTSARLLRKENPNIKILLFTADSAASCMNRAKKCGAAGVLSKSSPVVEIIKQIERIVESGTSSEFERPDSTFSLSKRQRETLTLLCSGLTSKEIAIELRLSSRTVESYKKHLMVKAHARNSVALTTFALKHGLVTL
jgi:DNA-binding NarL/FixJ family response regulator